MGLTNVDLEHSPQTGGHCPSPAWCHHLPGNIAESSKSRSINHLSKGLLQDDGE